MERVNIIFDSINAVSAQIIIEPLSYFKVYVTSTDPAVDTGYDPDINRRRPEHPDRPLPRARTIRGIDRSAFAVGKTYWAFIVK